MASVISAKKVKWIDVWDTCPPVYYWNDELHCRLCLVTHQGMVMAGMVISGARTPDEEYDPDTPIDTAALEYARPSSWSLPVNCASCGMTMVTRFGYVDDRLLWEGPSPIAHPLQTLANLIRLFIAGKQAILVLNGKPGVYVNNLEELLGHLPRGFIIDTVAMASRRIDIKGHKDSVDGGRFMATRLTAMQQEAHQHEINIADNIQQAETGRIALFDVQDRMQVYQRRIGQADLLYTKERLEEFFHYIPEVRRWSIPTNKEDTIEMHLWPVRLYRDTSNDPAIIVCGPHTATLLAVAGSGAFQMRVKGPHPHWTEGVCHGVANDLAVKLLRDGELLQYIRLFLDLRRGWNEKDQWAPVQRVVASTLTNYSAKPFDFEWVQDGKTGALERFIAKKGGIESGTETGRIDIDESQLATSI